jgi:hypothetical protein
LSRIEGLPHVGAGTGFLAADELVASRTYTESSETLPAPERLLQSTDERKSTLDRTLQRHGAQGWRIESRSDFQATIATDEKINHILHLILTLLTFGLWGIVWIILASPAASIAEW